MLNKSEESSYFFDYNLPVSKVIVIGIILNETKLLGAFHGL
ncbi:hypothetical protein A359_09250 [secondary endosymbiont of Ctenarytaina eucalypti]|uniref:Uncharacterized protein n=1 Tax=secondary endosymbiont of Ctenarytaina eucalypti TaxID=1199245 RepID=J3TY70_9ENTR|nr:hypothetical protein A359_09250 [secondary endosymbiont of Ctenarytaina eucalypti]